MWWLFPCLLDAAPFVTTWKTTTPNETVTWPTVSAQTALDVDWGDGQSHQFFAGLRATPAHTYATAGTYNVSMSGEFRWRVLGPPPTVQPPPPTSFTKLLDIVSWGDGFLVDQSSFSLFTSFLNLRVSAPANTQPVFLSGSNLAYMFQYTSFNSTLNWDLANVTNLQFMFASTPLNQPITFLNTHNVVSMNSMFFTATSFNQPINFDCSSVTDLAFMFSGATSFNSPVTLTNTQRVTTTNSMFAFSAFNQPVTFRTDSVSVMTFMFSSATKFNQPVNFSTSQVVWMTSMFEKALSFNQPINFQTPRLQLTTNMFQNARSLNQPITMDTTAVTSMRGMFSNATSFASTLNFSSTAQVTDMSSMFTNASWFEQDLASWDTSNVTNCSFFCDWCGLPSFPLCLPCAQRYTMAAMSVCYNATRAPSVPTSIAPTMAPSSPTSPTAPTRSTNAVTTAGAMAGKPALLLATLSIGWAFY